MQNHVVDMLLTDLRYVIRDLGKHGGLIGPSIYDTAQVVRLAPPPSDVRPALEWLVSQQQPDGGWGDPANPHARDVPTLAAILTLHTYATTRKDRGVVQLGMEFLRRHMKIWAGPLPDHLPVGIELILPHLLGEAQAAGLIVPREPYEELIALGRRRLRMIANLPLRPGTIPAHVWEAYGTVADVALIDETGGVGHSPAATAAWLRASSGRADLSEARTAARRYLEAASAVTGVDIDGVVPTAWPITRFEQSNALYALLVGGLLDHPDLQDVIQPQIHDLAQALRPEGLGFSDIFTPDGDDTAEALAVLQTAGYPINLATLDRFACNDHFCAYPGELQPALSVTAHAVHVLRLCGQDSARARQHMVESQFADGRWCSDKWNGSWFYTTCQVVLALAGAGHSSAVQRAVEALLAHQREDGGWGTLVATTEETAYGVLMLRVLLRAGIDGFNVRQALGRAERWMLKNYRPFDLSQQTCWQAKESYRPRRLARIIELAATFPSVELAVPLQIAQFVGGTREMLRAEQGVRRQDVGWAGV